MTTSLRPTTDRPSPADPSECARCDDARDSHVLEWAELARGENELRRLDRHFNELLQELRVVQTGAQILFAFLLGLAFMPRFAALEPEQRAVHLTALVLAAGSLVLLVAPVSYHRMVFRRRMRQELVTTGHRYVRVGLVLLFLALVGAVHLAASLVLGPWSALLAALLAAVFAVPWYLLPLWHRSLHRHEEQLPHARSAAGRGDGGRHEHI
jgi:O-antigen/teichoic acid export membrane protein